VHIDETGEEDPIVYSVSNKCGGVFKKKKIGINTSFGL
jgi:hypothetical protein